MPQSAVDFRVDRADQGSALTRDLPASMTVADFWTLLVNSRLLTGDECRQLAETWRTSSPEAAKDLQQTVKWLVQSRKITRYQAKVLLRGQPGPFF